MEEKNDTVIETISLQNDNRCDFNSEFRKTNAQDIGCPINGIREQPSRNQKKDERKTLLSVDRIENPSSKQS